jgi:hypothetical protein
MLGSVKKSTNYLTTIKTATLDPRHPRHCNIKMQAHHVISAEGVRRSGLGSDLVKFGYNINVLSNLVFIPSTLQGACYLGIQPHRGNHPSPIEEDTPDDDGDRPMGYHDMVKLRVKELKPLLTKKCPADDPTGPKKVQAGMEKLSARIIKMIQYAPASAALTKIAKHFSPHSKVGCGGLDSVDANRHGHANCPVERNHLGQQGPGQKKEQITYQKTKPYILEAGQ